MGQSILRDREAPFQIGRFIAHLSKGYPVNIPELGRGFFCGDASELGDISCGPGKSFLFSLTCYDPGIGLSGDRVSCRVEHLALQVSGVPRLVLENPRERMIFTPSRTHNRIRSPR